MSDHDKGQHVLIARLFRVQPGEGRRVAAMLIYSVALVGGVIITGQLVGRALFLSALPREAIPYKFILPPLALMLASTAYAWVAGRARSHRLILWFCILSACGVIGFRVLLATAAGSAFVTLSAMFVFVDIVGSLAVVQFWTFAGEVFDAREARRLFGLIAGGSAISNVLFGATLAGMASRIDPADLLYPIAISLLVCAGAVLYVTTRCRGDLPTPAPSPEHEAEVDPGPAPSLLDDLGAMLSQPLLRTIIAIVVAASLASGVADYVLDLALQQHFGHDSQGMVGFLGSFRLLAGLLSAALQFFLASRLLERFGVVAGLALLPVMMALGSGAVLLAAGALWAAAVPRACDVVIKYTVHDAALNLLYLPIDSALRSRARALLDGVIKPPVVGLLGLAFLLADRWAPLPAQQWAVPLLIVVFIWLLLMRPASRHYVTALTRCLRMRRLDLDAEPLNLTDDSSIRVVRESLRSTDEGRIFHAMHLVEQIPKVDFSADLEPLTRHASPHVRRTALRQLARTAGDTSRQVLRRALVDDDLEMRGVAVEELCAAAIATTPEVVAFVHDPQPRIRAAAILGVLRRSGPEAHGQVHASLVQMLNETDATVRLEGVRALRYLGEPAMAPLLIPRLSDDDFDVRELAVRGAMRMPSAQLVPALVPALSHASLRSTAAGAIGLCLADDIEPALSRIADRTQPLDIRSALLRILGSVPHDDVVEALVQQLERGDPRTKLAACESLLQRHRADALPPAPARVERLLEREVRAAYSWHTAIDAVKNAVRVVAAERAAGVHLLLEALEVRFDETCTRILILLDLIHPELTVERLQPSLQGSDRRARAAALELLDSVVSRDLRPQLVPLLSPVPQERREGARRARIPMLPDSEQLHVLQSDDDPWVQRCARLAAGDFIPGEDDMALSTLERVFFLKSVSFFRPIPGEQIDQFVPILREVSFVAGQTIIRRGDPGTCLYILVEGDVEIHRDGQIFTAGSTEVIGERSVLTASPRSADCIATTEVVALRIDKDDFWDLMREQPGLTIEVMRVVLERYAPADG